MEGKTRPFDVIGQLGALRRYARVLVRNADQAEDLVHDALVKAYERKSTFRSGGNLRTWLMSIVHNTHVDALRRNRSGARRDEQLAEVTDLVQAPVQDYAVRLAEVRRAFDTLPEEQREALYLVAVDDLSYQEAADTLGIPVGTLMSRISRARARLRALDADRNPGIEPAAGEPSSGEAQSRTPQLRIIGGKSHDDT